MKISTFQFGELEFSEDKIITFENGLFGFEQLKKFLLLKKSDEIFYWLNSVDRPEICFPVVGVRVIDDSYPTVIEHEAFGIVTMNKNPLDITVNLKAPVYINQDRKTGFQKILDSEKFQINYNLFLE